MPQAHLSDRGVVRVGGEAARAFLDGLLTCGMDRIAPGRPRFGALLSPQGKILFDFLIHEVAGEDGPAFLIDCARVLAPDLVRRLGFYRLRAKVTIADVSEGHRVLVGWADAAMPDHTGLVAVAPDPRLPALGWRGILAVQANTAEPHPAAAAFHAHRIANGVPEAGKDFLFSEAFPHEALMDQLHGVDFDKGCYVGQEVVSRMQHRGTARTRIVPIVYLDGFVAEAGVEVTAGGKPLGKTGTSTEGRGLAMLRLDRAADALGAGETIRAGGLPVRIEPASWTTFPFPVAAASPAA